MLDASDDSIPYAAVWGLKWGLFQHPGPIESQPDICMNRDTFAGEYPMIPFRVIALDVVAVVSLTFSFNNATDDAGYVVAETPKPLRDIPVRARHPEGHE